MYSVSRAVRFCALSSKARRVLNRWRSLRGAACARSLMHLSWLCKAVEAHHRFLLEIQLGRAEDIEANIAVVDAKIDEAIAPHRAVFDRLITIPGVDRVTAVIVIAEMGIDTNVF